MLFLCSIGHERSVVRRLLPFVIIRLLPLIRPQPLLTRRHGSCVLRSCDPTFGVSNLIALTLVISCRTVWCDYLRILDPRKQLTGFFRWIPPVSGLDGAAFPLLHFCAALSLHYFDKTGRLPGYDAVSMSVRIKTAPCVSVADACRSGSHRLDFGVAS